jgi:hypothetical protein
MHQTQPHNPKVTPIPNPPAEAQTAVPADERIAFTVDESAYGQHLGLVNWNEPDRWYDGEAGRNGFAEH